MKWHMRFRGYTKINNSVQSVPVYDIHTDSNIGCIAVYSETTKELYIGFVPEVQTWFITPTEFIPLITVECRSLTEIISSIGSLLQSMNSPKPGIYVIDNSEIQVTVGTNPQAYYTSIHANFTGVPYNITGEISKFNTSMSRLYIHDDETNYYSIKTLEHNKYPLTNAFDFKSEYEKTGTLFGFEGCSRAF